MPVVSPVRRIMLGFALVLPSDEIGQRPKRRRMGRALDRPLREVRLSLRSSSSNQGVRPMSGIWLELLADTARMVTLYFVIQMACWAIGVPELPLPRAAILALAIWMGVTTMRGAGVRK